VGVGTRKNPKKTERISVRTNSEYTGMFNESAPYQNMLLATIRNPATDPMIREPENRRMARVHRHIVPRLMPSERKRKNRSDSVPVTMRIAPFANSAKGK